MWHDITYVANEVIYIYIKIYYINIYYNSMVSWKKSLYDTSSFLFININVRKNLLFVFKIQSSVYIHTYVVKIIVRSFHKKIWVFSEIMTV